MQRIGAYTAQIERIGELRQRYRKRQIARHGWNEGVDCAECGDTGWLPEGRERPCGSCAPGRRNQDRLRREQAWTARCPARLVSYTLDGHPNAEAAAAVRAWLDGEAARGVNLVLTGHVGTGKTGLAIAVLREATIRGRTVRYGTVADILDGLRPRSEGRPMQEDSDRAVATLQRTGVLLLDDLGVEKSSEWQAERLYMIVNGRHERALPTVVTTNRTQEELAARAGERVVSRLMDRVRVVALTGADRRGGERRVVMT